MGIQTNIVTKNGNPPIFYNIVPGKANTFPKNVILDANYVEDIKSDLQEQIDSISTKGGIVDIVASSADLNNYDTSALSDGDIIQVLSDEMHSGAMTYYKWHLDQQQFEYLGGENPYYSKDEIDRLLNLINTRIDNIHGTASVEREEISINIP